ncbi:MAG TPA: hypothetical protein VIR45_12955 [Kiloniellaceae bacterium]
MAIFPPQISQAELERLCLLRAGLRDGAELAAVPAGAGAEATATDKKAPVVRPPLAQALSEELRASPRTRAASPPSTGRSR